MEACVPTIASHDGATTPVTTQPAAPPKKPPSNLVLVCSSPDGEPPPVCFYCLSSLGTTQRGCAWCAAFRSSPKSFR
jgi:hypothetical protein